MKFFVYILESLEDQKFYIGQTNDIIDRVERHNNGQVKATRNRVPLKIIHTETFTKRTDATKREKYLKSLKSPRYIEENIIKKS